MAAPREIRIGFGLLAVGVAVLALPAELEGPVRVPISPGHGLSVVDGLGAVFCAIGSTIVYTGLWKARRVLASRAGRHPGRATGLAFTLGIGIGLLVASAFSTFWWWWAVGAAIYAAALALAGYSAASGE